MGLMLKLAKALLVGLIAIFLVTVGIDAVDHYDNLSESIMGRLIFGEGEGPCSAGMVFISTETGGFCIDEYEASASDDCIYEKPSSIAESQSNIDTNNCLPVSKPGNFPWTNISQNQAARLCAKAGKRLPSSKEWMTAALGTPDKSAEWTSTDCQVANNWDIQPGLTGSGEKCVSYAGTFDMIGNVWEWTDDSVLDGKYNDRILPKQGFVGEINQADGLPSKTSSQADSLYYNDYFWIKDSDTRAIARGGYWGNKEEAGQYALYVVLPPSSVGSGVGFRCAK